MQRCSKMHCPFSVSQYLQTLEIVDGIEILTGIPVGKAVGFAYSTGVVSCYVVNILYISQINFTCYGIFLRFVLNNVFQFASILHLSDALPSHWVEPWSHLNTLPLKSQIPCDQEQINYRMGIEYELCSRIVRDFESEAKTRCNF